MTKRIILAVMFFIGLGTAVYSQNKKEKVTKEYHLCLYPMQNDIGVTELHMVFPNNKKLKTFLFGYVSDHQNNFFVDSTYSIVVEEVRIQGRGTIFRVKARNAQQYPVINEYDQWEIACFSRQVKSSNGKYSVEVNCVAGKLSNNNSVNKILEGLFDGKVINPNIRFTVILQDTSPEETDISLKNFKLVGVPYVSCPEIVKKD